MAWVIVAPWLFMPCPVLIEPGGWNYLNPSRKESHMPGKNFVLKLIVSKCQRIEALNRQGRAMFLVLEEPRNIGGRRLSVA